jgi:hypothetical protein
MALAHHHVMNNIPTIGMANESSGAVWKIMELYRDLY